MHRLGVTLFHCINYSIQKILFNIINFIPQLGRQVTYMYIHLGPHWQKDWACFTPQSQTCIYVFWGKKSFLLGWQKIISQNNSGKLKCFQEAKFLNIKNMSSSDSHPADVKQWKSKNLNKTCKSSIIKYYELRTNLQYMQFCRYIITIRTCNQCM